MLGLFSVQIKRLNKIIVWFFECDNLKNQIQLLLCYFFVLIKKERIQLLFSFFTVLNKKGETLCV